MLKALLQMEDDAFLSRDPEKVSTHNIQLPVRRFVLFRFLLFCFVLFVSSHAYVSSWDSQLSQLLLREQRGGFH